MLQLLDDGTLHKSSWKERQGQGERRREGIRQRTRKTTKGTGKKSSGNVGQDNRKPWAVLGRAARSDTRHQNVDGESPTPMKKMQTAEKTEDNLKQNKMEKSGGV